MADIVERHGGSLRIESREGKGTTVRLRLHASRFQIIPPSEETAEPVHPERAARVLLVDDDQRLLLVLSDMLRSGGHQVTTAVNGEEAIATFDPTCMLPLISTRIATLTGDWRLDCSDRIGRNWPLSRTSKSGDVRPLTIRPRASRTDA